MKKSTRLYVAIISVIGLAIGVLGAIRFFSTPIPFGMSYFILCVITVLCRCLPLYLRDDMTFDMSFIAVIAIALLYGPLGAMVALLITTPLVITQNPDGKTYSHLFNTSPEKTFFNAANLTLTLVVAGWVYSWLGGEAGNISLPGVLLPMTGYLLAAIITNSLIMNGLFAIEKKTPFLPTALQMLVSLLPSMACCAPIGYLIAYIAARSSGASLVVLFMMPLLLARYSFKLFLRANEQQVDMIRTLTAVIEAKDAYTEGHSSRVSEYAVKIAGEMKLGRHVTENLHLAALFHDIGKIGVPESVLCKPGKLTDEEWVLMKQHPVIGTRILHNTHYSDQIEKLVRHHHEFYNGRGYPDGTKGGEIPFEAYVLGVADAFDAMTSDRPYRQGMTPQRARDILVECSGGQFHPDVATTVARMIDEGKLVVIPPKEKAGKA